MTQTSKQTAETSKIYVDRPKKRRGSFKLMTRIIFPRADSTGWGIEALTDWGYTVWSRDSDDERDCVEVEAVHDVTNDDTPVGMERHELVVVDAIVKPYAGSVVDIGPVPRGHTPFAYETAAWRNRRRHSRQRPVGSTGLARAFFTAIGQWP